METRKGNNSVHIYISETKWPETWNWVWELYEPNKIMQKKSRVDMLSVTLTTKKLTISWIPKSTFFSRL